MLFSRFRPGDIFNDRRRNAGEPAETAFGVSMFLLLSVTIIACAIILAFLNGRAIKLEEKRNAQMAVNIARESWNENARRWVEHLRSVSNDEVAAAEARKGPARADLARIGANFETLLMRNAEYAKMRWIKEDGFEHVRVNRAADGHVEIVPNSQLQYKGNRYFFGAARKVNDNAMYFSPIDLNVEHGRVEKPYQPMIRLAKPMRDNAGQPNGIFLLNVRAKNVLRDMAQASGAANFYVLNDDGYWLRAPDARDEFSFVFKKNASMATAHPGLWKRMQGQASGEVVRDGGVWAWTRVKLAVDDTAGPTLILVVYTDATEYRGRIATGWATAIIVGALLLLAIGMIVRRQLVADQEKVKALAALEHANLARSQFLANISHELRTPLNALIGYGQLLQGAQLDDDYRYKLDRLNNAGLTMLRLVNDILDLTKIEAGELRFASEPFDLRQKLVDVISIMGINAQEKGLILSLNPLSPSLPKRLIGDPLRLHQILFNLVGNAIKFTDKGEITISVRDAPADNKGKSRLRFEVNDTGIGISDTDQMRLFARFSQVDESHTRRFAGTGLGLAIVKELAERMNGAVEVQSKLGIGSTFSVELEFEPCAPADLGPEIVDVANDALTVAMHDRRLEGVRILLVDDSDLNLDVADLILSAEGAHVFSCTNGQEAIDWLRNPAYEADVVLMDVQMPVMDGNMAVAVLRMEAAFKQLPVIAMTAGATLSDFETSIEAGMSDYIVKPFMPEQLVHVIRRQLGHFDDDASDASAMQQILAARIKAAHGLEISPWSTIPGVNVSYARHRCAGDWVGFLGQLVKLVEKAAPFHKVPKVPIDRFALAELSVVLERLADTAARSDANAIAALAQIAARSARVGDRAALLSNLQKLAREVGDLKAELASRVDKVEV